jgi:copper(I)-binding protein
VVQKIAIAPRSALRFEATGYHLMLEHPTRKIAPGDHVTVMLRFD